MTDIVRVRGPDDIDAVRGLAWAFVAFLRDRYPEMQAEIDAYLEAQDFVGMLASFTPHFNPPTGECLLARVDGAPAGILMLKRVDDETCEMNRMFVDPGFRGHGVGRALCERLFAEAVALGYRHMRLTALYRHTEALALYESMGFERCEMFEPNHDKTDQRFVSMRRALPDG